MVARSSAGPPSGPPATPRPPCQGILRDPMPWNWRVTLMPTQHRTPVRESGRKEKGFPLPRSERGQEYGTSPRWGLRNGLLRGSYLSWHFHRRHPTPPALGTLEASAKHSSTLPHCAHSGQPFVWLLQSVAPSSGRAALMLARVLPAPLSFLPGLTALKTPKRSS